jgi:phosphoribosyl 1,2-cyclic phosphodiesterase
MESVRIGMAAPGGFLYSNPTLPANCILVEQDGIVTMLDAGCDTYTRAKLIKGWNLMDVERIVLTHRHSDHMGDAVIMIHGIQKLQEKYRGYVPAMEIIGPAGTKNMIRDCMVMVGEPDFVPKVNVREGTGKYGNIRMISVSHGPKEAYAAVLYGNREIFYTGDLDANPANLEAIIAASESPYAIISEATEPDNEWHIDIWGALKLMSEGDFKQMYTVHTRSGHRQTVRHVCRKSHGRVIQGKRGQTYTIR